MDMVTLHSDQINDKNEHKKKENYKYSVDNASFESYCFFTIQIELD